MEAVDEENPVVNPIADPAVQTNSTTSSSNTTTPSYLRNALIFKWLHRFILIALTFISLYFGADSALNNSGSTTSANQTDTNSTNTNTNQNLVQRNQIYLIISAAVTILLMVARLDKRATVNKILYQNNLLPSTVASASTTAS